MAQRNPAVNAPLTRPRKTVVRKQPMFCTTDDHGRGGWREVPISKTHTAVVKQGDEGIGVSVYVAKGWKTWGQTTQAQKALLPEHMANTYGLKRPAGAAKPAGNGEDVLEPYHQGRGWYEIGGRSVRGREDALALLGEQKTEQEDEDAGEEG